jgi:hypothetical protein
MACAAWLRCEAALLRGLDSDHILLGLFGHFDEPPAASFKACYVADTHGSVMPPPGEELSSFPECRTAPLD